MRFEFFPLRFEFAAAESLFFPPGKAANILRGALGTVFRRMACSPACVDHRTCTKRNSCPYATVFAPTTDGHGPSGLANPPLPFVFRARHLDGRTISPDECFYFDLHVFALDPEVIRYFVLAFSALAQEGLGPRRGKLHLQRVRRIAAGCWPEQVIYEGGVRAPGCALEPVSLNLKPVAVSPRLRVEFLSPTELKHGNRLTSQPRFPILFGLIRDRICTLRRLYGNGPLAVDFQGSGARAAAVQLTHWQGRRVEVHRRSSRTGQSHSLGGFVGIAEYEGELSEFLPYLQAGRWTGVGRQSVWGKGEFEIKSV
jgi:hypothetical protein